MHTSADDFQPSDGYRTPLTGSPSSARPLALSDRGCGTGSYGRHRAPPAPSDGSEDLWIKRTRRPSDAASQSTSPDSAGGRGPSATPPVPAERGRPVRACSWCSVVSHTLIVARGGTARSARIRPDRWRPAQRSPGSARRCCSRPVGQGSSQSATSVIGPPDGWRRRWAPALSRSAWCVSSWLSRDESALRPGAGRRSTDLIHHVLRGAARVGHHRLCVIYQGRTQVNSSRPCQPSVRVIAARRSYKRGGASAAASRRGGRKELLRGSSPDELG